MFRMLGESSHSVEKSFSSDFTRGVLSLLGGFIVILLLVLVIRLSG